MNGTPPEAFSGSDARPSRRRLLARAVLLSGLMLLLTLLGVWLATYSSRKAIDQRLAEIRARGEPTTADEAATFYAASLEGEDATQLWRKASEALVNQQFEAEYRRLPIWDAEARKEPRLPLPGQPWPEFEKAVALIERNDRAFQWAYQAADKGGHLRLADPYFQSSSTINTSDLHTMFDALRLAAHVHAYRGDADQAFRSLRTSMLLGRATLHVPTVISVMSGTKFCATTCLSMSSLMPRTALADDSLREFQQLVQDVPTLRSLKRELLFERCFLTAAYLQPHPNDIVRGKSWIFSLYGSNFVSYLDRMQSIIDLTNRPMPEALSGAAEISTDTGWPNIRLGRWDALLRPFDMLTIRPDGPFRAVAWGEAIFRATSAAVAAELYRREHGRLPNTLRDLVPQYLSKVPRDPCDGQPLRYRRLANGALFYSVGKNLADEDGQDIEADKLNIGARDWGLRIDYGPPAATDP